MYYNNINNMCKIVYSGINKIVKQGIHCVYTID